MVPISCEACGAAAKLNPRDILQGETVCPYCGATVEIDKLEAVAPEQRELLGALRLARELVSFDDYREDVARPADSRLTLENHPGERFRAILRRQGMLDASGIGCLLVLVLLGGFGVWLAYTSTDTGEFDDDSGPLLGLILAGVAVLVASIVAWIALRTEEIRVEGGRLVRLRRLGPIRTRRIVPAEFVNDLLIVKGTLFAVWGGDTLSLASGADVADARYLRRELLAFLRPLSATGLGCDGAVAEQLAAKEGAPSCATCGGAIRLAPEDVWRGKVACPSCGAVARVADVGRLTPAARQALAVLELLKDNLGSWDSGEDDTPPNDCPIEIEAVPGISFRAKLVPENPIRMAVVGVLQLGFALLVAFGLLGFANKPPEGFARFFWAAFAFTFAAVGLFLLRRAIVREILTVDTECLSSRCDPIPPHRVQSFPLADIMDIVIEKKKKRDGTLVKSLVLKLRDRKRAIAGSARVQDLPYLRAEIACFLRSVRSPD